jgi:hypothetical protein
MHFANTHLDNARNIHMRKLGVISAPQRNLASKKLQAKVREDMAAFEPEGGNFLRTTMDDIPLSSKAPRRRKKRKVDEDGVGNPAFNRTRPQVAMYDTLLGAQRRKRKRFVMSEDISNPAFIEMQDLSGVWRKVATTQNNLQIILKRMEGLKQAYPNNRIRAVDSEGHLLDILP